MTAPVAKKVAKKAATKKLEGEGFTYKPKKSIPVNAPKTHAKPPPRMSNSKLPGEDAVARLDEPAPKKTQAPASSVLDGDVGAAIPEIRAVRALGTGSKYERALKAEWLFGMLVIFLYPLFKPNFAANFNKWISRQIAWTAVFIMLLLLASFSDRIAKICAAFGGLSLLALLLGPYVTNGNVTFSLNGANALKSLGSRLLSATGTAADGSAAGSSPTDTGTAEQGAQAGATTTLNLGDGSGPIVYRDFSSGGVDYLRKVQ